MIRNHIHNVIENQPVKMIKGMDNLIFRSNQEQNKFIECNAVIPLNVHKRWENIIKVVAPQWLNLIRESNDHRTNT